MFKHLAIILLISFNVIFIIKCAEKSAGPLLDKETRKKIQDALSSLSDENIPKEFSVGLSEE